MSMDKGDEDDIDLFVILGRCLHRLLLREPEHRADWWEVSGEEGAGPDVRGEGAPDLTTLYGVAGILPRQRQRQRLSAALDECLSEEGSSVSWASGSPETARDLRLIDHALRERDGEGQGEGQGEGEGEGAKRQRRGDSPPGDSSPDSVRIKPTQTTQTTQTTQRTLVSLWGEEAEDSRFGPWGEVSWTRLEILVARGRPRRRSAFT